MHLDEFTPMILLCNDDGFNAAGLRALYLELSREDDVIIVAPATEQSAMGHAITLTPVPYTHLTLPRIATV